MSTSQTAGIMNIRKSDIDKELLAHAEEIAGNLMKDAIITEHFAYWETLAYQVNTKEFKYNISETVYSGASGIILFFIEMYKVKNAPEYRNTIIRAADWVIHRCKENPSKNYAFYTGQMGVAYTLIAVSDLVKDKKYVNEALSIARNCEDFFDHEGFCPDILSGYSGTILGLLHLYDKTKEEWLLAKMDRFLKYLISDAKFSAEEGVSWGKNGNAIKDLCGFSHGVSGIAFVLLELGRYFNNEAWWWLAEQVLAYENRQFNHETGNWPDFRILATSESMQQDIERLKKGELEYFYKPSNFVAWCHGATGIGLSRIRTYGILKNERYLQDIRNALGLIKQRNIQNGFQHRTYTLCHGLSGDALLFASATLYLDSDDFTDYAYRIARQAMASKGNKNFYSCGYSDPSFKDNSLLMGNAGVGLFFLALLTPGQVKNILLPVVESVAVPALELSMYKSLTVTKKDLVEALFKKVFPRTIHLHNQLLGDHYFDRFDLNGPGLVKEVIDYFDLVCRQNEMMKECYKIELIRQEMSAINYYYFKVKNYNAEITKRKFLSSGTDFNRTPFLLNRDVRLHYSEWNFYTVQEVPEKESTFILLRSSLGGVEQHIINELCYDLFACFELANTVDNAIRTLKEKYEVPDGQSADMEKFINNQALEAVKNGILLVQQ